MTYKNNIKTLYSITFDLSDLRTRLEPCIPETAALEEDKVTKRVCLAPTVSQCIQALGPEHRDLRVGRDIIVRAIDKDTLDPALILYPPDLRATKRVPDALEHQEHWYLGPIDVTPERFTIKSFQYEHRIAFSCISIAQIDELIKKHCPEVRRALGESVKSAYMRAMETLQSSGRYKESDDFDEDVASLPFAQTLRVYDLRLEKPTTTPEGAENDG